MKVVDNVPKVLSRLSRSRPDATIFLTGQGARIGTSSLAIGDIVSRPISVEEELRQTKFETPLLG